MKCVICKNGITELGTTTVTMERNGSAVVVRDVPARICRTCGEAYLDEEISSRLMKLAESAIAHGAEVEIRSYAA